MISVADCGCPLYVGYAELVQEDSRNKTDAWQTTGGDYRKGSCTRDRQRTTGCIRSMSIVLYYGEDRRDSPLRLIGYDATIALRVTETLFFDYGINLVQIIDSEHYSFHNEAVRTVFEGAGALLRGDLDFIN